MDFSVSESVHSEAWSDAKFKREAGFPDKLSTNLLFTS